MVWQWLEITTDTSSGGFPSTFYMLSTWLMGKLRFQYDKKDSSFMDLPPPVDAHAATWTHFESHGFAA
jgi:hypothetical protein